MTEARIQKIKRDIEVYKEAIDSAEAALMEAQRELDELDMEYGMIEDLQK